MNGAVVGSRPHPHKFSCPTWNGHDEDNQPASPVSRRPGGTGPRTRGKGGLCLPSVALQHLSDTHVPFFQSWVLQNQRGNWRKLPGIQEVLCLSPSHVGLDPGLGNPQVASLMLQSLVFCVEKSSLSPPNLSCGARLPLDPTAPCVEELHQESTSFQPTVLASPPPRLTSPEEKEPSSPRPAETPWACSVWPHLPSSPSSLPPASTNSTASLCGRL